MPPIHKEINQTKKNIRVAVWAGNTGKTISIDCNYFDKKTDAWVPKKSFFYDEIELLIETLENAKNFIDNYTDGGETPTESNATAAPIVFQQVDFEDSDIPF